MRRFLKEMKWEAFLMGCLYILLGVIALALPETMEKTLAYLIGTVLVLAGAVSMICYLIRDAHQNYYHNDFLYGLVEITLGCVVLHKLEMVIGMITFLLGLLVLVSGYTKLQDVIDMKRLNYGNWVLMLVLAALNVGIGILLIFYPFKTVELLFRVIGISLIISGAGDIFVTFYFAKKISIFLRKKEEEEQERAEAAAEAANEEQLQSE